MTRESELPPRPDLDSSRETIDSLDRELLRLLARRMDAEREIADFKQRNPDAPLRDESGARGLRRGRAGLAPRGSPYSPDASPRALNWS
jgi:chorismate mutase